MRERACFSVVAALVAVAVSGCGGFVPTGETREETRVVEVGGAERARVEIRMGAGDLDITGGTPKLLEASFRYNVADWKPIVDYRVSNGEGSLRITQPDDAPSAFGNTVNDWNLNLNAALPSHISASLGAGDAKLTLGQMDLREVEVHMGAGEVEVDLRGNPKSSYSVRIRGGVGEATVYLPRDVGIKATASGGIGEIDVEGLAERDGVWINPDRIDAPVTVTVDVKGGVGEIKIVR